VGGFWGKEMTKAKRIELMENAYDVGISSFDYADIYGNYNTENDFGTAFSESGLLGDKLQFISKCGIAMTCGNKPYKTKYYNYSSSYIIDAVHNSLRNLKT
jgi:predicted oxidoreductase